MIEYKPLTKSRFGELHIHEEKFLLCHKNDVRSAVMFIIEDLERMKTAMRGDEKYHIGYHDAIYTVKHAFPVFFEDDVVSTNRGKNAD